MAIRLNIDPDPILASPIAVRGRLSLEGADRREIRKLVFTGDDASGWCREPVPEEKGREHRGAVCSRPKGHPGHWKHVAATSWTVLATWGGGDPPTGGFADPEDGTPEDSVDHVPPRDTIEVGRVYRLRDRKNTIQVIGGVGDMEREDGLLDVLDFTKREYRAIPADEIVVDPGVALTVADLEFAIEYAQRTRMKIRDAAVENYHLGRWCEAGLQDGLRDLGLPKYVPTQRGEVVLRMPYSALSGLSTSKVKRVVEEAVNLAELKATLATAADPEDDDELVLNTDELKLKIENVGRR